MEKVRNKMSLSEKIHNCEVRLFGKCSYPIYWATVPDYPRQLQEFRDESPPKCPKSKLKSKLNRLKVKGNWV